MSTFDKLVGKVLAREGGFTDHAADRGGRTNKGILQRVYSEWLRSGGLNDRDVRGLTDAEARAIYKAQYWTPAKCDLLPEEIRDLHFDSAVNHGVTRAAKLLQDALGVEPDGVIGPKTLAAVASASVPLLRARYIARRYAFYGQIIARDRSQLAFIVGWMNRMREFADG